MRDVGETGSEGAQRQPALETAHERNNKKEKRRNKSTRQVRESYLVEMGGSVIM